MTRGTPGAVTTPFRSTSSAVPVWLVDIPTGLTSPATLRYTSWAHALTFGAQTYSPWPMDVPQQQMQGPGESGTFTLRLGDADGVLGGYIDAGATFEGRKVVLYLTDESCTGGAGTDAVKDTYVVESYSRGEGFVALNLRPLFGVFQTRLPVEVTTRKEFAGLPQAPTA